MKAEATQHRNRILLAGVGARVAEILASSRISRSLAAFLGTHHSSPDHP